jgi:pSer/pThr/pTyr-binding forkhead associated (FHA) protein
MPKLVVTNSAAKGATHELGGNWTTIGRADGNNFQIVEGSISGRHCEVRLQGGELSVRDLLSTNGTFINGQKVSEATLKAGQILRLGDVEIHFDPAGAPLSSTVTPGTSFNSKMLVTSAAAQSASKPAAAPAEKPAPAAPADNGVKKFHVVLVDDSLAFLENFGGLCLEYSDRTWDISYATSADRALALLQERPADLAVIDIGMPMLDGLQLLGIISRRYPGLKLAVMTGNATEAKRADALANGAELFLEKPVTAEGMRSVFNMLNDLVSWTRHEGFSGSLRQVGIPDVIQMECLGRNSSVVEIRNSELRGQIYIENGAVTHAVVGTLTGEQAFYRLLSLRGGEFQVKSFKAPLEHSIQSRWEFLLMEAARTNDEETVMLAKPAAPAPAAPAPAPVPAPAPIDTTNPLSPDDDFIVVATYDGTWTKTNSPETAPPAPEKSPDKKP